MSNIIERINRHDMLLEIGVEEIPAGYMPDALEELQELAAAKLAEARLDFVSLEVMGTPRRLVLLVKGLADHQPDASIENRGPKKSAAYAADGKPTKAAEGFARGQGIQVADLVTKDVDGTEYIYAVKTLEGKGTWDVLPALLPDLILSLPFPKSMRWGYYPVRFARPIRWLVALYADQVIEFEIAGVKSGKISNGHRFLGERIIRIDSIQDYKKQLSDSYIMVDNQARQSVIWEQIQKQAADLGGRVEENPDLLSEITFLVEYPTAFAGRFSPSYLDVPVEVLTTSMIENQRYFPVFSDEKGLLPYFISVRNGLPEHMENVIADNERVLTARLEDALFFWREDTKKPLESLTEGLDTVMFHAKLGSLRDKTVRMQSLAVALGQMTGLSRPDLLDRAAFLCKADLRSSMVYEFPELQGIMGRYYALKSGEEPEVAEAIMEHYMPRSANAELPATDTGRLLALTEKFDNMTSFFAVGMRPSGSQDPYALRRNALGAIGILRELSVDIDIKAIIDNSYAMHGSNPNLAPLAETREALVEFIMQRLKGQLVEQGYGYDVVDAVLAGGSGDIKDIVARVSQLQDFKIQPAFEDLMIAYNRANNLSKKWDSTEIDSSLFEDASEGALYQSLQNINQEVNDLLVARNYSGAMECMARLRPEADNFFNAVMVMVEDEKIRSNRLGLLKAIACMFKNVAEFALILP